jgi:hypothetical protein
VSLDVDVSILWVRVNGLRLECRTDKVQSFEDKVKAVNKLLGKE